MRMQPKFTEALFMLTADGLLQGHDPEAPGPDRSCCLESNQTPVKVLQNYSVCSHQESRREIICIIQNYIGFQCIVFTE